MLHHTTLPKKTFEVQITGSKSESNRLLILKALYPNITIENLSESDDTKYLQKALNSKEKEVDIHHAGTAMRFLTAYFACKENSEVILTGSERMQERPIGILVEALRQMGADIQYEKNDGYPPLKIRGKKLTQNKVSIAATTSSQFISALMLIAPSLPNGLTIQLEGKITSVPYINMTLALMQQLGIEGNFSENNIYIPNKKSIENQTVVVESDWSSASYFYSIVALSKATEIVLKSYRKQSLQGDAALSTIYTSLGVETEFFPKENAIKLSKSKIEVPNKVNFNLVNTPDIAQTIAVTCFGLGTDCELQGLHTLKIKETDRLTALKVELEKLGAYLEINEASLKLTSSNTIFKNVSINTYNDHRMAMAFAPLALKTSLQINDCEVVSKSYPTFWEDLKSVGFSIDFQ
ncbi:3-phosphoshikimate 1-carboxyvinyltransferase [Aureisphaera sp. CAU 1614]|uniref:3-phosphoshikimate 1-carboxyvinyltransferase n=1 Tax=Halomarinibacterium sedimenti TaxID=2857106 RepID=A0A9X1FL80_9FLAO|nr:3-phosphoshikimate 1-carboxyvinyltransferase [Halomarinibacterium sedimenti]